MNRVRGFTLAEVLVALAVIGIAFAALSLVQVNNLRASSGARLATETKAAANQVLEKVMAKVLTTEDVGGSLQFHFNDYYWSCPTPQTPPSGAMPVVTTRSCTGSEEVGSVAVDYSIAGEAGITGEGVLTVTITATHDNGGAALTIGDRVTCYDIYPSPTSTAPEPCPAPAPSGGGRK